jgi:hypothetical protein
MFEMKTAGAGSPPAKRPSGYLRGWSKGELGFQRLESPATACCSSRLAWPQRQAEIAAGALAGRPAGGPIAAEELAPAAVQPLGRLEQALHVLAGGGRVLQAGLDGP